MKLLKFPEDRMGRPAADPGEADRLRILLAAAAKRNRRLEWERRLWKSMAFGLAIYIAFASA
jgi:hypothetical protein